MTVTETAARSTEPLDATALKREFPGWGVFEAPERWFAYRLLPITAEQRACGAHPEVTARTALLLRNELLTEADYDERAHAMSTSSETNGQPCASRASGGAVITQDGQDGERDAKRVVAALEVQVGRPLDRTPCDGLACSSPAAVSVSMRTDWAPHFYCAEHWPAMDAMFRERGHTLTF